MRGLLLHNTLKRKVFTFIVVILICFLSGFLYTFYTTLKVNQQINEMFTTSIELDKMNNHMEQFEMALESYLASKSSDSFVLYLDNYNALMSLSKTINDPESGENASLQMKNIGRLLNAYLEVSEDAIEYKRGRNTERYLFAYSEMLTIGSYIDQKVQKLESWDFKINLENYMQLTAKFSEIQVNLIFIVVLLVALSLLFVFSFSTNVTSPIIELSKRAEDIARGIYSFERNKEKHFKEAEVLKDTFYDMASHIQKYITELEDKVETENKLRVSETEKLKMQYSLNQAELMALQSQINPHFLFNTLNAGMQLAIIEDADRTAFFLENLSSLFRYNIQSLQNKVKLEQEFDNARKYYELMRVRFGDQFHLEFALEDAAKDFEMPPLILQPIIENALIHGFKNKTEAGRIKIEAYLIENHIQVDILDNGEGIEVKEVLRLNQGDFTRLADRGGHTTGLGLGNVYERLRHFFEVDHLMHFESVLGDYTKVTITLPRREIE